MLVVNFATVLLTVKYKNSEKDNQLKLLPSQDSIGAVLRNCSLWNTDADIELELDFKTSIVGTVTSDGCVYLKTQD